MAGSTRKWSISLVLSCLLICAGSVEFPLLVDADDLAYFSSTYDLDGLEWALQGTFNLSHRVHGNQGPRPLLSSLIAKGGGSHYTTAYKLELDLEQARFIAGGGAGGVPAQVRAHFVEVVVPTLAAVLARVPPLEQLAATQGLYAFDAQDRALGIEAVYNRALYLPPAAELDPPGAYFGEGGRDVAGIEARWEAASPRLVVIDDLLSPEALRQVKVHLAESTAWYQTKMPTKFGGYSGAYIDDGLHQRLLLALAFALKKQLPGIFEGHDLRYLWAYKYQPGFDGISVHADEAAVNVNIWVADEDANLDPRSGGLVVFTAKPPPGWDFESYNTDTARVVDEILRPTGFANVTVPHRENRAVIFDSDLFHHTDKLDFTRGGGVFKRRINLTLLYGKMDRKNEFEVNDPVKP
mmetsp:Transcript_35595/g.80280  ORF Transcript_35595/g.80280 Transcript_35595/m.80280 type:complete len:409 (-) Transcript_35595:191-1417(-)|eukprot:CAMPEP_0172593544 /NCGR_PEP_ID=MMETSP1068-20121228/12746_1 /TAXON_ID=35684 /ORGANISM="Pseudopedinella elastica, Strain CCMP716" /LENGTH=408 /DNA_ID=CAMNT_0013391113 /DNA_START=360 /DNA_END=1586 /DNA_ORIENTATION=+